MDSKCCRVDEEKKTRGFTFAFHDNVLVAQDSGNETQSCHVRHGMHDACCSVSRTAPMEKIGPQTRRPARGGQLTVGCKLTLYEYTAMKLCVIRRYM